MTQRSLQETPFRIRLRGSGTFIAVAATGIITPKTKRAIKDAKYASVRATVEAFASSYLKRNDWMWRDPMAKNAENQMILGMWVDEPSSAYIRDDLQRKHAKVCIHGRNPCYARCGVKKNVHTGEWSIVPRARRREWLDAVLA